MSMQVYIAALQIWNCLQFVCQGPGGVTTSSTLLGPVLVWSQQNYLKFLLIVRYFGSS